MERKAVSWIMLALLLANVLTLTFNIQPVKASGTIYIRPDSSIDPPTARIQSNIVGSLSTQSIIEWNKTYGGPNGDVGYSVQQTSDGGYAIIGGTDSFGAGSTDYWLVKTDANGNMQWNRTYGGTLPDTAFSGQQTSDGGYIMAGDSYADYWLVKTDANGNMQWNIYYGLKDEVEFGSFVQQTSDEGYIIAGEAYWSLDNGWDYWLVKTDEYGEMQWNRTYHWLSDDSALCVRQTSDGGYIVVGDNFILETDSYGVEEWRRTDTWGRRVEQTSDGGYIIASSTTEGTPYRWDFLLVKTDPNGNIEWRKIYGEPGDDDFALDVEQATDGGYVVVGYTYDYGTGVTSLWFVHTDANGNMQWNMTYGGYGGGVGYDVELTTDEGYIITGGYLGDAWLIKLAAYNLLTISATTGGTTSPAPGTDAYPTGTVVSVTALPNTGYTLDHWELDGSNVGATNPITVTMNTDHTLQAVFVYNVTIQAYCYTEAAYVSVSITMDGTPTGYNTPHTFTGLRGTRTFTVSSTDASGHPFKQWSSGGTTTTITVSSGGTYTAYYQAQYTLTITTTEGGTTSPAPGIYTYWSGTILSVAAMCSPNYQFDHWELDGSNAGSTNPISVTMDTNHALKAFFVYPPGVGGVVVAVDKLGLLAPYIGLASTIVVATVATAIYVKRVKRRKVKQ